ncbi:MAG: hypothetical protein NUV63_10715 [Gallionella sp.]|nr:hypothetical protein [Gallionella sp.]
MEPTFSIMILIMVFTHTYGVAPKENDASRGFKSAWARAMVAAMKAGNLTETFAENDQRARVATVAIEPGQNATAMLGHSSHAVTKRHYQRGTQKVEPLRGASINSKS